MSPERWERLKVLFGEAWERPATERAALLDSACAGDPDLRREVEGLLAADPALGAALDEPSWVLGPEYWPGLNGLDSGEEEPALLTPGAQVGRFRVVRMIGRGGMGEVYEAEQESPRRRVALKVIRPATWSRRAARRLAEEASMLARLDHPGIARVIEAGLSRDTLGVERPFIAMDLVDGPPITVYANESGLSPAARVELMRRVCDAVEHAHRRGVIHRDLKPGNILVDAEGRPRVLDFGVARAVGADARQTRDSGFLPGTLAYMSPEQATGDPDAAETRSDVYSLGVVLYELLTGRHPHAPLDRPPLEMLRVIREDDPPRASVPNPSLRGDPEAILCAALAKDPSRRYASAAALGADLGRWLRHEPVSVGPDSVWYALRKYARRHRALTAAAGAGFAALSLGVAGTSWQLVRANRANALAARNQADYLSVVSHLMVDVYEAIVNVPGTMAARQRLASGLLEQLPRVAALPGAPPEARRGLARAHAVLGSVSGAVNDSNQGDREAAVHHLSEAVRLYESLIVEHPGATEWRIDLARACHSLALTLDATGRAAEALPVARRAVEVCRLGERPWEADPALWLKSAEFYLGVATTHMLLGAVGDAVRELRAMLDEADLYLAARPEEVQRRRLFGLMLFNIGNSMHQVEHWDEAISILDRAAPFLEVALAREPLDLVVLSGRADLLRCRAIAREALGDVSGAADGLRECLLAYEHRELAAPGGRANREMLAWMRVRLVELLLSCDRLSEAADASPAAVRAARALADADPASIKAAGVLRLALAASEAAERSAGERGNK